MAADKLDPQDKTANGWVPTHTDRSIYQDIKLRAHHMRRHPTPAENRLWQKLRRRQICGFHFRQQHPIGQYIVDFFCAKARLVIEVDGAIHSQPGQDEYDIQRQSYLEELGLQILRFTNHEVMSRTDTVLERIAEELSR